MLGHDVVRDGADVRRRVSLTAQFASVDEDLTAVVLVLVFAFALSWAWTTLGLVLRSPNAVMSIGFVILFPLTFMSNIFVDPDTMPAWLRTIAEANPISHLATAERGLMQGTSATGDVVWVLAAAAVLTVVFAPLTTSLYRRRQ